MSLYLTGAFLARVVLLVSWLTSRQVQPQLQITALLTGEAPAQAREKRAPSSERRSLVRRN